MSFAIWDREPPFTEAELDADGKWTGAGLNPGEKIIKVGDYWIVTDVPERATPAEVDKVLNAPKAANNPVLTQNQLAAALAAAGLSDRSVTAAIAAAKATQ